jgi:hypothetical protein
VARTEQQVPEFMRHYATEQRPRIGIARIRRGMDRLVVRVRVLLFTAGLLTDALFSSRAVRRALNRAKLP